MKYYVSGGTGAGDFIANTIDEAKQLSDENTAYTQTDISIFEIDNEETVPQEDIEPCYKRIWWGVPFDASFTDDVNPICFGDFGYYGDWE